MPWLKQTIRKRVLKTRNMFRWPSEGVAWLQWAQVSDSVSLLH